ncbi:MAG: GIY-YIG nuclease family protein [Candidatus Falkowbacteria bacterium]
MFKVYLLKSQKDNKYYIGQTQDIDKRLEMHNSGCVKSTKSRIPFILIGFEEFKTRDESRYREYELKTKPHKKKKFIEKLEYENIEK